jgi:hypothetical protein
VSTAKTADCSTNSLGVIGNEPEPWVPRTTRLIGRLLHPIAAKPLSQLEPKSWWSSAFCRYAPVIAMIAFGGFAGALEQSPDVPVGRAVLHYQTIPTNHE